MIERKCQKCGTIISRISFYNWAYKDDKGIYCSWTCYNHRNDKKTEGGQRKAKIVEMSSLDGMHGHVFTSATEAAEFTGFRACAIRDACRLQKQFKGYFWKYRNEE